jgi:hypothetical protein
MVLIIFFHKTRSLNVIKYILESKGLRSIEYKDIKRLTIEILLRQYLYLLYIPVLRYIIVVDSLNLNK